EVALITRTLLSRPNLEKVARMTDLDLRAKTPAEMESLLDSLGGRISFIKTRQANLYNIRFNDSDPVLAKKVVQALLTIFVESSLGSSRKDTDSAQRFLDEQITVYEARLIESENRLKEFKRKNVGIMPGSGGGYYGRLQTTMSQLKEAQLQQQEAINRRDELISQLEDAEDDLEDDLLSDAMQGTTSSPLDARIQNLQVKLDNLLLKYTKKHPDVISIQTTISGLQAEKQAELESMSERGGGESSFTENPVVQQLKIALGEAEAVVASINVRVEEYKKRVQHLEAMVNTIPQVEAELKNLNRDYGIVKSSYETLLSRRESARMGQEADESGETVQFRVIDPPRVPLEPSGPNRTLFLSIVLLAGLGAGLGVAFLLSQLRATFDNRNTLRDVTEFPVLGTISMEWTRAERVRMRLETMVFTAFSLALIMVFGLVILFQDRFIGLLARFG
ncbi:MAG TPA: chain length-determining protein, partial [Candidatus Tenderia electrophaga]|nr:chain length-determining protein [Candidatus Tenderia electrophaga]